MKIRSNKQAAAFRRQESNSSAPKNTWLRDKYRNPAAKTQLDEEPSLAVAKFFKKNIPTRTSTHR
jgi:hypothetical protein